MYVFGLYDDYTTLNCSEEIPADLLDEKCSLLAKSFLLAAAPDRMSGMMHLFDHELILNVSPVWLVLGVVALYFTIGAVLLYLPLHNFPYTMFTIGCCFKVFVCGVLIYALRELKPWPLIERGLLTNVWLLGCDALMLAASAQWLGTGILLEFGATLPLDAHVLSKSALGILVHLVYVTFFGAACAIGYLAESQSIGKSHGDDVIVWPLWTTFTGDGMQRKVSVLYTTAMMLMGMFSTVAMVYFFPLQRESKPTFLRLGITLMGLMLSIGACGFRAVRVLERGADLFTGMGSCIQLCAIAFVRATASKAIKMRNDVLDEAGNSLRMSAALREKCLSVSIFLGLPFSALILAVSLYRVVIPFEQGMWLPQLRRQSYLTSECITIGIAYIAVSALLILRPIVLYFIAHHHDPAHVVPSSTSVSNHNY
ncbi:unnamed protein product, partial [Mesorhabditis spiculigera]